MNRLLSTAKEKGNIKIFFCYAASLYNVAQFPKLFNIKTIHFPVGIRMWNYAGVMFNRLPKQWEEKEEKHMVVVVNTKIALSSFLRASYFN